MGEIEDFDSSTAAAWTRFQARLADHLAEMDDDDLLLLEVEAADGEDDDGTAPYVQFCAWGAGRLRCEAVSNQYLKRSHQLSAEAEEDLFALGFEAPTSTSEEEGDAGSANYWVDAERAEADRVAVMAVRALRDVYGATHPAFLTGHPFADLDEAPTETAPAAVLDTTAAYPSDGPDHLRRLVVEALTPFFGHVPVFDEDGDIPVSCGPVTAYVRVLVDRPVVRIFACLSHGVQNRARADFEANVLNREVPFFKFLRHGDAVFLQTDVVAWPFVGEHLRDLLGRLGEELEGMHDDLAARLDGPERDGTSDSDDDEPTHPAMLTLMHLDADEPGSVDASLAAAICGHDRDLILRLLTWNAGQEIAWRRSRDEAVLEDDDDLVTACEGELVQVARTTAVLRGALRVVVERQAARLERRRSHDRGEDREGSSRREVPGPRARRTEPRTRK